MDKRKVFETLFDDKIIKILRLFVNNPNEEYYLREISRHTKVSTATTFRIVNTMRDLELLKEQRNKHLKTYSLIAENASFFIEMLEDKRSALQEFSDFVRGVEGVDLAILHGKEEKDRVSVLVVGHEIDSEEIRSKSIELKQKYGFNIILLVLDPEQYDQMVSMGLYPGKKVILYSREE